MTYFLETEFTNNLRVNKLVKEIAESRPDANSKIKQYLMTPESLQHQLRLCENEFVGKKSLFIGDDDHLSILVSLYYNTQSTVLEIDERVISNIKIWSKSLNKPICTVQYDVANPIADEIDPKTKFDIFCVNPPYGSKNYLYGAKVWISRCLEYLKIGGTGLIILPINSNLEWTLINMLILQEFLTDNNCIIYKIDKDVHSYDNQTENLVSSNIWIKKLDESMALIGKADQNLYE